MDKTTRITTEEEARKVSRPHKQDFTRAPHNPDFCCASIHDEGRSVGFHQCRNRPKYWYGALGYCGIHDPNRVKARREASDAKVRRELEESAERVRRADRKRRFLEECEAAVRFIAKGHNDPRSLCKDILERYPELQDPTDQ